MDVFPKFIIETDDDLGDCLIIAKCTYHHQLVTDKTKVKGGGWWSKSGDVDNTIILFGDSHDFGASRLEDIQQCIINGNVYTSPTVCHSIAGEYKFVHKNECGEMTELENPNVKQS